MYVFIYFIFVFQIVDLRILNVKPVGLKYFASRMLTGFCVNVYLRLGALH